MNKILVMKNTLKNQIWEHTYQLFISQMTTAKKQVTPFVDDYAFHQSMKKLLPPISRFISQQLEKAIKNKAIPSGKYQAEDLIDDLYIMAYDHVQAEEEKNLYNWLRIRAKELIEDTIIEVDFNQTFFENIDNYTRVESAEMEERFSVDGDGDLVMEEELDDLSYPKHDYILNAAFIQDVNYEA